MGSLVGKLNLAAIMDRFVLVITVIQEIPPIFL